MTSPDRPTGQVVIGVDVGTTAAKVVAFGLDSPWRHVAVREYPLLEPVPGHQVQDPEMVVAAAVAALADCVAAARGSEVVALSVCTAMHGLIGLDDAMEPLTPLVTWADARAVDIAGELRRAGEAEALHQLSGTPVHPMSPLVKLLWFRRNDPSTWRSARWWVGLKDFLLWRLTGTLATELSSASGTGLLDLRTRAWSDVAAGVCGVDLHRLPPVLPTTQVLRLVAAVADRVGLPAGTPVVVGAADGPLGNLGTGAMDPGVVGLSVGTSGAVRVMVERPPDVLDPALFCYALTGDVWCVGGALSNGGIVVRWAGGSLTPDLSPTSDGVSVDEQVLELAAGVPAGSEGLVMLPYLLAERAPLWDPEVTGSYLGLRRSHTRAHLVRAAVEGVALQVAMIMDRMDDTRPLTSVRATGGVFRSRLWQDVMAAAVGRPLFTVGDAEGSALGAAALALHAVGRAPRLEQAPALLHDPEAGHPELVPAAPRLVAAFEANRALVAELIGGLSTVQALFAGGGRDLPADGPTGDRNGTALA